MVVVEIMVEILVEIVVEILVVDTYLGRGGMVILCGPTS